MAATPDVLARRIDHLIQTVHPKGRGPFSLREIAEGVNEIVGKPLLSKGYLSMLRTGQRTNPSPQVLSGLARFFGVPATYFSNEDTAEQVDHQLELVLALRDNGVRQIATRAAGLSEESLQMIISMVEHARKLEGLPDEPDKP